MGLIFFRNRHNAILLPGLILLVVLACNGGMMPAWGAEGDAPQSAKPQQFKLRQVVVKDKAKETKRLTDPVPQTEVTREEIEIRNNRRAGDVIRRLPGVFMGGPPGENKDI